MLKYIKITLVSLALLIGVLVIAIHNPAFIKRYIVPELSKQLEVEIELEDVSLSLLSSLRASGIVVGPKDKPLFSAKAISLDYDLWEILSTKTVHLTPLRLSHARITLPASQSDQVPEEVELSGDIRLKYNSAAELLSFKGDIELIQLIAAGLIKSGNSFDATKADLDISYSPSGIDIRKFELLLADKQNIFADLAISGKIKFPLDKSTSDVLIRSKQMHIDKLVNTFAETTEEHRDDSPTENCLGVELNSTRINVDFDIAGLHYAPFNVQELKGRVSALNGLVTAQQFSWKQGEVPVRFDGSLNFSSAECPYSFGLQVKKSPFGALLKAIAQDNTGIEGGTLEKIIVNGQGKGFSKQALEQNLAGSATVAVTDAALPSKFQDIPPFNLIFLPFKVLTDIGGTLTSIILPEALVAIGTDARSILDQSGQLMLKHGIFKLKAKDGVITIDKGEINTDLLPTVNFEGDIGFDGKLDLTTTLYLLALQLRLPIAGTLSVPLPDIVELGPQLIKGLGLSIIDPISKLAGSETTESLEN